MSAPESPSMPRPPARELLLEAAARLFYAQGVAATGIDTITTEAGVAKKSLYNNFSSKADLVASYLEARHEEWLGLYRSRVAAATTPADGVLAVFDAYLDHANFAYEHGFRGCGLLNAAAELPVGNPGRDAVRKHKEQVEDLLATHVAELVEAKTGTEGEPGRATKTGTAGAPGTADDAGLAATPKTAADQERTAGLARHLSFLLEGAMARAGLEGDDTRLRDARLIARQMLADL